MNAIKPSAQEETILAAIAHAAVIISGVGAVAGLVIYLTQKEKSWYAAGQALQAAVYQLAAMLVTLVLWGCWSMFYALTFIPLIVDPMQYQDAPPPIFWVGMGSMVLPFIGMGVLGLYGLYGAWRAWQGKDFRYIIIGKPVMNKIEEWSAFGEL